MGKTFAYGYGTTINDLILRDDAADRIFDLFSEKRQKAFVAEWRKKYPKLEWDEALDKIMAAQGIDKMLADIINENSFGGKKIIIGEKDAIYAEPSFPKSDAARAKIPSEKELRDAIAVHLQACFKGVRKRDIGYYFFEE